MSEIAIAERLRPFSHLPGTLCLLPGSHYAIQIYPCLLRIFKWDQPVPVMIKEIKLLIKGPVENFTVQCDLEKGCLRIWGKGTDGFFRYEIKRAEAEDEIVLYFEKGAPIIDEGYLLEGQHSINLLDFNQKALDYLVKDLSSFERLSLGNHKAQDWDLVRRRLDLTEIFPSLYRLAQWVPSIPDKGTTIPLHEVEEYFRKPELAAQAWKKIFLAVFQGILTPFWEDELHQGIIDPGILFPITSPLHLLKECLRLMRLHFFEQREDFHFYLLPVLPPEFHCGRFIGLQVAQRGTLDFEWTKKTIRRLVFHSEMEQDVIFHFKKVESCRFKKGKGGKGIRINTGQPLALEKNCYYFFDNFH